MLDEHPEADVPPERALRQAKLPAPVLVVAVPRRRSGGGDASHAWLASAKEYEGQCLELPVHGSISLSFPLSLSLLSPSACDARVNVVPKAKAIAIVLAVGTSGRNNNNLG